LDLWLSLVSFLCVKSFVRLLQRHR
jgi:hypothetical protein